MIFCKDTAQLNSDGFIPNSDGFIPKRESRGEGLGKVILKQQENMGWLELMKKSEED